MPASPFTKGPGSVGFPIQIGGQEVETGDMIVADQDGVVIVPFELIDETISALSQVKDMEMEMDKKVGLGLTIPESISDLLRSIDVKYID
jgi:4-hydroxy-4-methyl-2-oxoglutarate aldolase